ncbi:asparaginase [Acidisoma cellulosilytica]|uniref:Asparaginase n=1 Tax=Acidisoma cellulosilyticum TaxID=2802395 RepID=A0A963Z6B7_9PROT|nr:asparaginase [Acidisoma cellulosilyticum]MCB8883438.1 asparaginase [Acidisoma cellulosilyticum]
MPAYSDVKGEVVLLTTGGTIASRHDAAADAFVAAIGADDMAALVQGVPPGVTLRAEAFCNVNSFRMDLPTAFGLAQRIAAVLAEPSVLGVVVTHGTDTMEESAFLVGLTVPADKPVVFTGAQRNAEEADTDGPRNLTEAVQLAASPLARDIGTVILFDGVFHAARDVRKTHTSRPGTFNSADHGKLGLVDEGAVRLYRRPADLCLLPAQRVEPAVALIKMAMGMDDSFMRWAMANGTRGFVLEAFGLGNCPPAFVQATQDAVAKGIPVLITSRCGEGRVKPVYGNGGGVDLAKAGAIFAGDLTGQKARILLSVLLGDVGPLDSVAARAAFAEAVARVAD